MSPSTAAGGVQAEEDEYLHSEELRSTHRATRTRVSGVVQRRPSAPTISNRLACFSFLSVFEAIGCLFPPYFIKLLNFQPHRGALHSSGHSELRGVNDHVFHASEHLEHCRHLFCYIFKAKLKLHFQNLVVFDNQI